jgi:hypothetical protein
MMTEVDVDAQVCTVLNFSQQMNAVPYLEIGYVELNVT